MEMNRRTVRSILGIVAFAILLFVAAWNYGPVLRVVQSLLHMVSFFFIGLSVAFILNKPMRSIETRLLVPLTRRNGQRWRHLRRPLAVVITMLLVLALVFLVVVIVIPEFIRTVSILTREIPAFMDNLSEWLSTQTIEYGKIAETIDSLNIDWESLGNAAVTLLRNGAGSLVSGTFTAATSVVSAIVNFVVGVILSIYILLSKEKLSRQFQRVLYAFVPERRADRITYIARKAYEMFSNFLSGQFLEAFILGLLCFIGMTLFRFQFALMVSVLVGITAVIPIFGAFIGLTVGAFMILVNQGLVVALWFVLFFVILQQIEGNLIYPHVVGKSVMLPGLWVLTAVTLGGNLAGIGGMFISVPLCSLFYMLLKEATDKRLARKLSGQGEIPS